MSGLVNPMMHDYGPPDTVAGAIFAMRCRQRASSLVRQLIGAIGRPSSARVRGDCIAETSETFVAHVEITVGGHKPALGQTHDYFARPACPHVQAIGIGTVVQLFALGRRKTISVVTSNGAYMSLEDAADLCGVIGAGAHAFGTGWACIPVIRPKAISVKNIGVINGIAVKSRVQATDVKAKILAALKRDAGFEADGIHVNVLGDKVILDGRIKAWHERSVAERAAWSAAGVCSVEDNLHVA